jgi:hypothetical protein
MKWQWEAMNKEIAQTDFSMGKKDWFLLRNYFHSTDRPSRRGACT